MMLTFFSTHHPIPPVALFQPGGPSPIPREVLFQPGSPLSEQQTQQAMAWLQVQPEIVRVYYMEHITNRVHQEPRNSEIIRKLAHILQFLLDSIPPQTPSPTPTPAATSRPPKHHYN